MMVKIVISQKYFIFFEDAIESYFHQINNCNKISDNFLMGLKFSYSINIYQRTNDQLNFLITSKDNLLLIRLSSFHHQKIS